MQGAIRLQGVDTLRWQRGAVNVDRGGMRSAALPTK